MLNQITLIGNLGRDGEVKANGRLLDLRVATSNKYKGKNGEWIEDTEWHSVKLWTDYAKEMAARYVKGAKVVVSGSIAYEEYNEKKQAVIKAKSVRVLSGKGGNDGSYM